MPNCRRWTSAFLLARRYLPAVPPRPQPFDKGGALLSALSIGLLIFAIDGIGSGLAWPLLALMFGASLVLFIGLYGVIVLFV